MLLGMVRPTSGSVTVLGTRIQSGNRNPWYAVGYLVETPHAYPELTVRQNLEVMRRLRPGVVPQSVPRIIKQLDLGEYADRRADTLSLGNAQRLGLAKALLHDPDLLILDEPANGLDPAGIVEIRELLLELAHEQGVTIFMSSHILDEVARLAHRIGIIHRGRLLQELDIAELERNRRRQLLIRTRDCHAAFTMLSNAGYTVDITNDSTIVVQDAAAIERPDDLANYLISSGHALTMLQVVKEDLEAYFLRLVGLGGEDFG